MPRSCSICAHAELPAINAALVASEPYRLIAVRFGTSVAALQRHKAEHMPVTLAKAHAAKETALADDLLAQVKALRNKAIGILSKAEAAGDLRTALMGIREARGCIELLAEMEGELNRQPQIKLYQSPQWIEVKTVLLHVLSDFPEARAQAAQALLQVAHD